MPSLAAAKQQWGEKFTFVVASDEEMARIQKFNKKKKLAIEVVKADFSTDELAITGYPTTLIFDKEGKEQERIVGERSWTASDMVQLFEKYQ